MAEHFPGTDHEPVDVALDAEKLETLRQEHHGAYFDDVLWNGISEPLTRHPDTGEPLRHQ